MRSTEYIAINNQPLIQAPISFEHESRCIDRIWVVTIMHSGTHYTWEHLKIMGYEHCQVQWCYNPLRMKFPCGLYQFVHTHIGMATECHRIGSSRVILTLRNPVDVYKTHVYRYAWKEEEFIPYIIQAFKDWEIIQKRHDAYIFRVDVEDQEAEVKRLGNWINGPSWSYKEQSRTVYSNFVDRSNGYHPGLFNDPPKEIFELARQYGY